MKLNGAQILIQTLIEQGVTDVFGYPGGQVINIYDALYEYKDKINHILTAHEQGASHAADGSFRLCRFFVAAWFGSSSGEQGPFSSCGARPSHCSGFSCCEAQALGHVSFSSGGMVGSVVAVPGYMWLTGLGALWRVGSSWTRDQTHVSCTGRQILYC